MMKCRPLLVLVALLAAIAPSASAAVVGGGCALTSTSAHPCCAEKVVEKSSSCCASQEEAPARSRDGGIGCTCGHQPDVEQPVTTQQAPRTPEFTSDSTAEAPRETTEMARLCHSLEVAPRDLGPPLFILEGALLI